MTESETILKNAIEKHNLHELKNYDKDVLISLINYAKAIGVNEGFIEIDLTIA